MNQFAMSKRRITFPREVLLVEIERRCAIAGCGARTRVGLTKEEARAYTGFECERCEGWNDDALTERDIPDWWEELTITALDGLRPVTLNSTEASAGEPGEVVTRLSDAWRYGREHGGDENSEEEDSV